MQRDDSHRKHKDAPAAVRHAAGHKAHPNKAADGPDRVDAGLRRAMIAEAAYFHAERRGFAPGDDLADWLAAENEIEKFLQQTKRE